MASWVSKDWPDRAGGTKLVLLLLLPGCTFTEPKNSNTDAEKYSLALSLEAFFRRIGNALR